MLRISIFFLSLFYVFLSSYNVDDNKNNSSILFSDTFDVASQGNYQDNVIQLPPPEGLG